MERQEDNTTDNPPVDSPLVRHEGSDEDSWVDVVSPRSLDSAGDMVDLQSQAVQYEETSSDADSFDAADAYLNQNRAKSDSPISIEAQPVEPPKEPFTWWKIISAVWDRVMGQVKGIIDLLKPSALTKEKTRKFTQGTGSSDIFMFGSIAMMLIVGVGMFIRIRTNHKDRPHVMLLTDF